MEEDDPFDAAALSRDENAFSIREEVLDLSATAWAEVRRRAEVIRPLAFRKTVPKGVAQLAGERLGLSVRTIYSLLARYKFSGGLASSLAPRPSSGGRGKGRLPSRTERIIADVIRDEYLTRQRKSVEAIVREVRLRCRLADIDVPARNTIHSRIKAISSIQTASSREGGSRGRAARRLTSAVGRTPEATVPLACVQMDHTPVDLILVDEANRKPLGRPYLTVAIDVFSRTVAGFLLSLEPPSATSVGLCLAHVATPKDGYLRRLQIEGHEWPVHGVPTEVHVDNGAEFHSEAFARGCEEHGIAVTYRPVATPHYGGIVERLIGTLMSMVHELEGTTFSNVAERAGYDSDAHAFMTLGELERWLTLAIVGRYHGQTHRGLREPPIARWRSGIANGHPRVPMSTDRFVIDFLPVLYRRVTREGIRIDHIHYHSSAITPWIAERDRMGKLMVRRDPRDLSRIYVLDPRTRVYVEVPCTRIGRPSISLFEHRRAVAELRLSWSPIPGQ